MCVPARIAKTESGSSSKEFKRFPAPDRKNFADSEKKFRYLITIEYYLEVTRITSAWVGLCPTCQARPFADSALPRLAAFLFLVAA
jgi:hypothetical protein